LAPVGLVFKLKGSPLRFGLGLLVGFERLPLDIKS
jgi:hypothetical protein